MTRRYLVRATSRTALPADGVHEIEVGAATEPARGTRSSDQGLDETGNGTRRSARLIGAPRATLNGSHVIEVVVDGWRFLLDVEDVRRAELRRRATRERGPAVAHGPLEMRAIIAGRIAAVRVAAGDHVEAGQSVLVVEAMKMQNELRAPRAGVVERIAIGEGQTIEAGDLLVVLR